ncbi:hypothetical protein HNY73_011608, partial [Argiope bruennichi]
VYKSYERDLVEMQTNLEDMNEV